MDTHVPNATVREALLSSARMRQQNLYRWRRKKHTTLLFFPVPPDSLIPRYGIETCLKMWLEAFGDAIIGSFGVEYHKRTASLLPSPNCCCGSTNPHPDLILRVLIMSFLCSLVDLDVVLQVVRSCVPLFSQCGVHARGASEI